MGITIHTLQSSVVYFSEKVNRLSISDKQNNEIDQLISSIRTLPHGTDSSHEYLLKLTRCNMVLVACYVVHWENY